MTKIKSLNWLLIITLGVVALIRPVVRIVWDQTGTAGNQLVPVLLTIGISLVWIAALGLSRVREPLLTGTFVGLSYAVFAIVLSAVLSPILLGHLDGPLARPYAIIPMLLVNAGWGTVCGLLAWGMQRARGVTATG